MAKTKTQTLDSMDEIASFCKRRGFIYPNSDIYGGLAGFWVYGHLGVELKRNIQASWWRRYVTMREDVVGIDGSIITHPRVWEASGHVESFSDPLLDCVKCKVRIRGDHLIEDELKRSADGMSLDEIGKLVKKHKLKCPKCGGALTDPKKYNLMFRTHVGAIEDDTSLAYLRPETAQVIFTNFRLVQDAARLKLPFGIAQSGKAYRNEIAPRNFTYRAREFEQMEMEYFVHPDKINECPFIDEVLDLKINMLTTKDQKGVGKGKHKKMTIKQALSKKIIPTKWLAYWLGITYKWFIEDLGVRPENLRLRQHLDDELAHYAKGCFDVEYNFPFGWKEIHGQADRTQFDLTQHAKFSGTKMEVFDEATQKRVMPYVAAEPSQGLDRALLAVLVDAHVKEKDRTILKLKPKLAPIQVAIMPLMKKDGMDKKAYKIHKELQEDFRTFYDVSGSIGRRYARQDEVGTPFCVTVDYDTKKDKTVTLRERDSTDQVRLPINQLGVTLQKLLKGKMGFKRAGKRVKENK